MTARPKELKLRIPRTTRTSIVDAQQHVVLAAIARREWLLGVLATSAAACRRDRRATGPDSRITILYPVDERGLGPYSQMPSQFLLFLPLTAENPQGELEGHWARHWEHSPDYRTWTR